MIHDRNWPVCFEIFRAEKFLQNMPEIFEGELCEFQSVQSLSRYVLQKTPLLIEH